jgi:hypothetical protein
MWLYVWDILDYMKFYKPHMDSHAPPVGGVADTIRTFMTSICVAQDMFLASLPCWLIWESKTFSAKEIFAIAEVLLPKNYIILDPHKFNYSIIYKGPVAGLKKFTIIEKFACSFCVPKIPLQLQVHPPCWLELYSLSPHLLLQSFPPV